MTFVNVVYRRNQKAVEKIYIQMVLLKSGSHLADIATSIFCEVNCVLPAGQMPARGKSIVGLTPLQGNDLPLGLVHGVSSNEN